MLASISVFFMKPVVFHEYFNIFQVAEEESAINLFQPSEELRGQHLGEFQQRTSKLFDTDSISLFINVP